MTHRDAEPRQLTWTLVAVMRRDALAVTVKPPFPYVGGKSMIADRVWERFGDVANAIEPFAGSCAVMLRRPSWHSGRVETINDKNHYVVNFWRAVQRHPAEVARHADWPVTEADLHARHRWLALSDESAEHRRKIIADPDYCDARMAGWWAWGQSTWIGGGWCMSSGAASHTPPKRITSPASRPQISSTHGVHSKSNARDCASHRTLLEQWMQRLADRIRFWRITYGDWHRVCDSHSTTTGLGLTGIFFDPPYPTHTPDGRPSRDGELYHGDSRSATDHIRDEVLAYCLEHGATPRMRIAVCGYDTDGYAALEEHGWSVEAWSAKGGYANQGVASGKVNVNRHRERIWFSPHCLAGADLFSGVTP